MLIVVVVGSTYRIRRWYEFETSSAFIGDSHQHSMLMVDIVIVIVIASTFFLVVLIIRRQGQDPRIEVDVAVVSRKRVIVDPKDAR